MSKNQRPTGWLYKLAYSLFRLFWNPVLADDKALRKRLSRVLDLWPDGENRLHGPLPRRLQASNEPSDADESEPPEIRLLTDMVDDAMEKARNSYGADPELMNSAWQHEDPAGYQLVIRARALLNR